MKYPQDGAIIISMECAQSRKNALDSYRLLYLLYRLTYVFETFKHADVFKCVPLQQSGNQM